MRVFIVYNQTTRGIFGVFADKDSAEDYGRQIAARYHKPNAPIVVLETELCYGQKLFPEAARVAIGHPLTASERSGV